MDRGHDFAQSDSIPAHLQWRWHIIRTVKHAVEHVDALVPVTDVVDYPLSHVPHLATDSWGDPPRVLTLREAKVVFLVPWYPQQRAVTEKCGIG